MGREKRPEYNPEKGSARLQYDPDTGRVIDFNPNPLREDEVFDQIPMRRLFGPLMNGKIHNPRFGNIFTGIPESRTHHNKENLRARQSSDFFGRGATFGYCPVWGDIRGRWLMCGRELCIKSGGCGVHGREGIEIYQLQARGESIPGRLMMDPKILEQRKKDDQEIHRLIAELELEESKVEAAIEEASKRGASELQVREELQKALDRQLSMEAKASMTKKKVKATAAKPPSTEATEEQQQERSSRSSRSNPSKSSKKVSRLMAMSKRQGGGKKKK